MKNEKLSAQCIVFLIFMNLMSCTSINITDVYKAKNIPGLPNVQPYFSYQLELQSSNDFTLNKIILIREGKEHDIRKFAVINKKTRTGFTVSRPNSYFKAGNYEVSFNRSLHLAQDVEYVKVQYQESGSVKYTKEVQVKLNKPLIRK